MSPVGKKKKKKKKRRVERGGGRREEGGGRRGGGGTRQRSPKYPLFPDYCRKKEEKEKKITRFVI